MPTQTCTRINCPQICAFSLSTAERQPPILSSKVDFIYLLMSYALLIFKNLVDRA